MSLSVVTLSHLMTHDCQHFSQSLVWLQELKSQCFGGEYTGEVYDQDLRR